MDTTVNEKANFGDMQNVEADFADGFAIPMGLRFIQDRLIVCDINGDYIGDGQELADGFVVEIQAQQR